MQIIERPKCQMIKNGKECGNEALAISEINNKKWTCGECMIKWEEKKTKIKEQLWIEG